MLLYVFTGKLKLEKVKYIWSILQYAVLKFSRDVHAVRLDTHLFSLYLFIVDKFTFFQSFMFSENLT